MQAHRVVLAACSPYFKGVLKRHPLSKSPNLVIHLRSVKNSEMKVRHYQRNWQFLHFSIKIDYSNWKFSRICWILCTLGRWMCYSLSWPLFWLLDKTCKWRGWQKQSEVADHFVVWLSLKLFQTKKSIGLILGEMKTDSSPLLRQSLQTTKKLLSSCTVGMTPVKKLKTENVSDTIEAKIGKKTSNL